MKKKDPPVWPMGPCSPSKEGKHYVLPPQNFPKTDKWCGACMPRAEPGLITKIIVGNTRAPSDRNLHPSRGVGC